MLNATDMEMIRDFFEILGAASSIVSLMFMIYDIIYRDTEN